MIRKLLRRVFSKAPPVHEPALIPVEKHHIRRESISPGARQTVARLQSVTQAGATPGTYKVMVSKVEVTGIGATMSLLSRCVSPLTAPPPPLTPAARSRV